MSGMNGIFWATIVSTFIAIIGISIIVTLICKFVKSNSSYDRELYAMGLIFGTVILLVFEGVAWGLGTTVYNDYKDTKSAEVQLAKTESIVITEVDLSYQTVSYFKDGVPCNADILYDDVKDAWFIVDETVYCRV